MAEPVSWAAVAVMFVGAVSGGISAKKAAEMNSKIMRDNADSQRKAAGQAEETQRRQSRQVLGEQRASIAQAGIGFSGSSADIMEKSSAAAELDALTALYEGRTKATSLENSAQITQWQGNRARTGGYLAGAGSLLSGAADYQANSNKNTKASA